jgi:hypothetical protein
MQFIVLFFDVEDTTMYHFYAEKKIVVSKTDSLFDEFFI